MADSPPIHHWLGGDELNADRMNEIKDSIDFLRNPPMAHVRRRLSNQTIVTNTWHSVAWDEAVSDSYSTWSEATFSLKIAVPGWYSCEMVIAWGGTATDTRFVNAISKNGITEDDILLRYDQRSLPATTTVVRKENIVFFNEGDDVRCMVLANGGTSYTLLAASDVICPQLRIRWISE